MIPGRTHIRWLLTWVLRFLGVGLGVFLLIVMHVVWNMRGDSSVMVSSDEPDTACALVFGAAVHRTSVAGPGITRRVEKAAELYRQGSVQTIILTGGKGSAMQESEAAVMKKVAMRLGIDSEDIILEEKATSTWENLLFTRELVGECSEVIGISDRYHLSRIKYLAELQEWGNLRTLPASSVPSLHFELRAVAREALGHMYYTLREYFDIEKYVTSLSQWDVFSNVVGM